MLTYILIAIGVSILTTLFMYIDGKLFDRCKKKKTYIKVIIMNNIIVFSVIYLLLWLSPSGNLKTIINSSVKATQQIVGNIVKVPEIGEEMLGGAVPF